MSRETHFSLLNAPKPQDGLPGPSNPNPYFLLPTSKRIPATEACKAGLTKPGEVSKYHAPKQLESSTKNGFRRILIDVFSAGLRACFTRRGETVGGCRVVGSGRRLVFAGAG